MRQMEQPTSMFVWSLSKFWHHFAKVRSYYIVDIAEETRNIIAAGNIGGGEIGLTMQCLSTCFLLFYYRKFLHFLYPKIKKYRYRKKKKMSTNFPNYPRFLQLYKTNRLNNILKHKRTQMRTLLDW